VRRLESCIAVVHLNNIVLFPTTRLRATRSPSAACRRFDASVILKGNKIRDVWHR
jgi:hypothetical protein